MQFSRTSSSCQGSVCTADNDAAGRTRCSWTLASLSCSCRMHAAASQTCWGVVVPALARWLAAAGVDDTTRGDDKMAAAAAHPLLPLPTALETAFAADITSVLAPRALVRPFPAFEKLSVQRACCVAKPQTIVW